MARWLSCCTQFPFRNSTGIPHMTEEELKKLAEAAKRMKNDILMEEPCPIYEADEVDWADFWYNEDK